MFRSFMDTLFHLNVVGLSIVVIILVLLALAFGINVSLVIAYRRLQKDLNSKQNREKRLFEHQMINLIVSDYSKASHDHAGEVNTQALIEKHFDTELKWSQLGERFVKTSVSLMIILGLVGTFFGLTISIGQLVALMQEDVGSALSIDESITGSLVSAMSGMSVAFITSLFGISASIIMTLFNLFFNASQRRTNLMVHIEEYLDNEVYKELNPPSSLHYSGGRKHSLEFREIGGVSADSLEQLTDTLVDRLYGVTGEMAATAEGFQACIQSFESSLTSFADSAKDFKEFNHHMRDNIQRMSLGFSDFTQEMNHQTEKIANASQVIGNLTASLKLEKQEE